MPKVAYIEERKMRAESLLKIERTNTIVDDYRRRGLSLTLRQLYYQFVARGWIPNNDREYDNLGSLINDARLMGLVDWYALEDRTRHTRSHYYSAAPDEYMAATGAGWSCDPWLGQSDHVEVWIEKDALVGVIERPCQA